MFSTLHTSQTGLNASRYAIDNVSNNQANKNTIGYKKRVADLSEVRLNGVHITGQGVGFDGISRVTSQHMYDKFMQESTKSNYYNKLSNMLGGVEKIFIETDTSGFSINLNRYFQSVENLRTNPHSEVYRNAMQTEGKVIVDDLQKLYSSVEKQAAIEKNELKTDLKEVNSILKEIADINTKIEKYTPATNDLLDKRDLLELELSKYVDVDINRVPGFYQIKIGGQVALSNNIFEKEIEMQDIHTKQVDKFNNIKQNLDGSSTVYDSLKYNDNFTAKAPYGPDDIVTYTLNSEFSVSVRVGETIMGNWDGDPNGVPTAQVVTNDNITRALMLKINSNEEMSKLVTAYNGEYVIDENGKSVPMYPNNDNYLRIESNLAGINNDFTGRISVERKTGSDINGRESIYRNETTSKNPISDTVLKIYEDELSLTSGSMRAQVENLASSNPNNKFQKYLDQLDSFAQTLSDTYSAYIRVGADDYIYGKEASDAYNNPPFPQNGGDVVNLNLFSGSSVKNLKFNKNAVNDLNQQNLDYLANLQWKDNLSFKGQAQNPNDKNATSFMEFYRSLKVGVSIDKEESGYSYEVQNAISVNLGMSYNEVVKVNPDDEMIDLMKFKAAFTANSQVITAVDQMIQTLLGMKR
ncbi:FlgK family flagellar hook-associated protein [Aliarcobacter thereius]|uniref:Flagellar hook-associated protein 1 n=1 Tax=Aliarcobacter thereius LMG 24486 TaxID=1032240 RepID=A0A1C7WMH8_9BACT|nr:flagellar basal body rod C-terminal domain-containing protein [Aliarcobacter thereius]OCL94819.1 Flagellar hook-associated protein 1 [Aliarcobacter thereius LMG 24486]QBF15306.1 proximal flagellar hook-filament junction protein [Aliarcobacter thereius LMG 24486]TLS92044.1 flagellar hook-associated protein FlgK [Aliarcobacter thereius]